MTAFQILNGTKQYIIVILNIYLYIIMNIMGGGIRLRIITKIRTQNF